MRDVCQLNVIKTTDPRLCILRHTKNWRAFEYRLLGTLGPVEISKLRKICIVMLNIYLLERPNYQYRQLLLQQTQSIAKKRGCFRDLTKQRKEVSAQLNAYVTTVDLVAKRKRVQELSEIVRASVNREVSAKASYTGIQYFPSFSKQEMDAADEIRAIKETCVLDEDGNVALPKFTKSELIDRQTSIRASMMETGKAIAAETDQQAAFKKRKPWRWDRLNRIIQLCEDLAPTCELFSLDTGETVPQQVVDRTFEVLSFAVESCARGLFELLRPINASDGYYLERTFFWDIVLCYHMCLVAKVRLSEMRALQSPECPVLWQSIVDLFQDLWSPRGIHTYYPDMRFQCVYTVGRLFQLRNLFYLDYGVVSKSTTDVLMQVIESFTPKKYQFTRSGGISEEYIRNDHESMAIPFLISVIVFFRIGLYYQCAVCIQDDQEYELMVDLYARRFKLHSQNPICKLYLEYVVQFFTKINPGMSVVAVNEFIMRNFYFSNSNLDAMNIPYRTCRVQIFTVCDAWRNKRFRKADISGIMLLMQFIKSQMAFHREVIQCPVNFFMMVFHRNTLAAEIEPLVSKRRSAPKVPVAAAKLDDAAAEVDGEQDPEPAQIVKSPEDPDEADKVLENNITTNPMNDLAQRAILGKRSVKSMICNTPVQSDQVATGQEDGFKVQKKKNRSSVSFFLDSAAAKESKAMNEFADNALLGEGAPRKPASSVNLSWFSFLVRSTAMFDHAAEIGAIMSSPRLLPHEKAVMCITGLYGQPARRFLASWRFAVLVGHPMGMTAEDECMLLIVLHDFCKQLGPSTLLNAVRKACLSRPIIPYIALLWKRFTSYTWAPISSQEALAQHKAITRRLEVFEIPQVTNLEYLLYCPVCGFVRTIYNSAMKIDSTEELRVVDGHKVMGFSGVKVYMLPLDAIEVMCARTGLLVSTICQGTRCLYVPTRYRIVYRAEQSQQWRVCGYCAILSMRDCESYFALHHPEFGELCSHCSLKYSRVKLKKDASVFQYQCISMNEYPGFEDVQKGEV